MAQLSVEQKAAIVTGADFWNTVPLPGIPSIAVSDGPHGVRRVEDNDAALGLGESTRATCFPPAAGIASSWNRALVEQVGQALGDESRALGVGVLLGPGVNIKRSPLCGRNFEYFSEDPLLSGELGASWVRGIQSRGVGAALKHFVANNQETNRMTVSVDVDERTLREIYLPAFETIVRREQPWTVMCSYNRLNGIPAAENPWLLTELLRDEWGFAGLVMSDWGAVDDRVAAVEAGLDLEMPGPVHESVAAVAAACSSPTFEATLDVSVGRISQLAQRVSQARGPAFDVEAHHALAAAAAVESVVLLRNEGGILPLAPGAPIAVIGEFAVSPRYQGAGSSQVHPTRISAALEAMKAHTEIEFAAGYSLTHPDKAQGLIDEAVELARRAETVVLFVGLPEGFESEGYDRTSLDLPGDQQALISRVTEVNPRTIVVLSNGGVVSLEPWHDSAAAIVESWLLGQAGGLAIADVLFGVESPSGRLAESIPFRLRDNPTFLNFPGDADTVRYGEGVFVGYRYFETAGVPTRYSFGYGLSYSTFAYSNFTVHKKGKRATVTVTNTGAVAAKEVVQLYVSAPETRDVRRPVRELRAFDKVALAPGESRDVDFVLTDRAFAFWDSGRHEWVVDGGDYTLQIGKSSNEIVAQQTVTIADSRPTVPLTLESPVSAWLEHPVTGPLMRKAAGGEAVEGGASVLDMVASMPMRRLLRFPGVPVTAKTLRLVLLAANNPVVRGLASLFDRQ
jgi:beta-glucosidase